MKKQPDKGKLLTVSVITFLCVVFVVGFIWGLNSVLAMEGAFPPVVNKESLSPVPQGTDGMIAYLDTIVEKAMTDQPKVEMTHAFTLCNVCAECGYTRSDGADVCPNCCKEDTLSRDGSFVCGGSDELQKTMDYICDDLLDTLSQNQMNLYAAEAAASKLVKAVPEDGDCDAVMTDFSASTEEEHILARPVLSAADVKDYRVDYIYYVCTACGETSDTPLDHCEPCGSTYPYAEAHRDEYDLDLALRTDTGDPIVESNFVSRTPDELKTLIGDKFDGVLEIGDMRITCTGAFIHAKVDRLTDELLCLTMEKDVRITAPVTFTGDYAALGTTTVTVIAAEKEYYNCTWPSLKLNNDEMNIEPGKTDNLLATLTCDDPTKPVVTWTCSDENVLTVDAEGYMKAGKAPGAAAVTASFEFLGKTYSDTCTVTVGIPVESIKISNRKLVLNLGEQKQLTTKVSPKNATVQSVKWYTEDGSVALVTDDGTVIAAGSGATTIYALSDDGFYKSSCEVTVR